MVPFVAFYALNSLFYLKIAIKNILANNLKICFYYNFIYLIRKNNIECYIRNILNSEREINLKIIY